ncbi:protein containing Metal-dependent phosphohydrolase, HD region, subdomain protein domain protein, partial [human gut metagenome]
MEQHEIRKRLKKELDKGRYEHTKGVMYTAGCMAMAYETSIEQAMLAGLLHDCAKCIPDDEKL